jgi:hypothetical protein
MSKSRQGLTAVHQETARKNDGFLEAFRKNILLLRLMSHFTPNRKILSEGKIF